LIVFRTVQLQPMLYTPFNKSYKLYRNIFMYDLSLHLTKYNDKYVWACKVKILGKLNKNRYIILSK
jgi:hypothetical protein